MHEQSKQYTIALIEGLNSLVSSQKPYPFPLEIKKLKNSNNQKILIRAHIRVLTRIIFGAKNRIEDKYIERTRKVLYILRDDLKIMEDLRFSPQGENDWFFLVQLWSDDMGENLKFFNHHWEFVRTGKNQECVFDNLTLFQKLLDAIPLPIFYKDNQGIYKGCNQKFQKLLGRTKEQIVGRHADGIFHAREAKIYAEHDENLLKSYPSQKNQTYFASVFDCEHEKCDFCFYQGTFSQLKSDSIAGLIGVMVDRKTLENPTLSIVPDIIDEFPQPS